METKRTQVLNSAGVLSLESWVKKTAVKLVQVNGQRKYGGPPPGWSGPVPGPGCEVYISQIPRDVYEDRLIPLFQSAGLLYEFRLMMNFSGQNRGFAYARYADPQSAAAVVLKLHRHELQEGVHLVVRHSTEKRQLLLGGLPVSMRHGIVLWILRGLSDGVETLSLTASEDNETATAVVRYSSHCTASMAKKVLCQEFKKQFAIEITVKWMTLAEKPRPDVDQKSPCPHLSGFLRTPYSACPLPSHLPRQDFDPAIRQRPPLTQLACMSRKNRAAVDAETLLRNVCRVLEVGPPLYHVQSCHTSRDGFLYIAFRVEISGLPAPFEVNIRMLPSSNSQATRHEVMQEAAERVLKVLFKV